MSFIWTLVCKWYKCQICVDCSCVLFCISTSARRTGIMMMLIQLNIACWHLVSASRIITIENYMSTLLLQTHITNSTVEYRAPHSQLLFSIAVCMYVWTVTVSLYVKHLYLSVIIALGTATMLPQINFTACKIILHCWYNSWSLFVKSTIQFQSVPDIWINYNCTFPERCIL